MVSKCGGLVPGWKSLMSSNFSKSKFASVKTAAAGTLLDFEERSVEKCKLSQSFVDKFIDILSAPKAVECTWWQICKGCEASQLTRSCIPNFSFPLSHVLEARATQFLVKRMARWLSLLAGLGRLNPVDVQTKQQPLNIDNGTL